jgi:hypothetical protein
MEVRLGQILIDSGLLDASQVDAILECQQRTGEPFGVLAERMYDINPDAVENAWASQYASLSSNLGLSLQAVEPRALELITRRQAWQFRILPIRFDHGELMMATTQQHLRRALRFATGVMGVPVCLVTAEPEALGAALCRHYPLPGMTPRSVNDDAMDRLLRAS